MMKRNKMISCALTEDEVKEITEYRLKIFSETGTIPVQSDVMRDAIFKHIRNGSIRSASKVLPDIDTPVHSPGNKDDIGVSPPDVETISEDDSFNVNDPYKFSDIDF